MSTAVSLTCDGCEWEESLQREEKREALQVAWSKGLKHVWEFRGHTVKTTIDGKRVMATQTVREMPSL